MYWNIRCVKGKLPDKSHSRSWRGTQPPSAPAPEGAGAGAGAGPAAGRVARLGATGPRGHAPRSQERTNVCEAGLEPAVPTGALSPVPAMPHPCTAHPPPPLPTSPRRRQRQTAQGPAVWRRDVHRLPPAPGPCWPLLLSRSRLHPRASPDPGSPAAGPPWGPLANSTVQRSPQRQRSCSQRLSGTPQPPVDETPDHRDFHRDHPENRRPGSRVPTVLGKLASAGEVSRCEGISASGNSEIKPQTPGKL